MGNGYSIAIDNDHMYEPAQDTASYRERGVGHDEQLARITAELEEFTVEVTVLRSAKITDKAMRRKITDFYKKQIKGRRSVRRHRANILVEA